MFKIYNEKPRTASGYRRSQFYNYHKINELLKFKRVRTTVCFS